MLYDQALEQINKAFATHLMAEMAICQGPKDELLKKRNFFLNILENTKSKDSSGQEWVEWPMVCSTVGEILIPEDVKTSLGFDETIKEVETIFLFHLMLESIQNPDKTDKLIERHNDILEDLKQKKGKDATGKDIMVWSDVCYALGEFLINKEWEKDCNKTKKQ